MRIELAKLFRVYDKKLFSVSFDPKNYEKNRYITKYDYYNVENHAPKNSFGFFLFENGTTYNSVCSYINTELLYKNSVLICYKDDIFRGIYMNPVNGSVYIILLCTCMNERDIPKYISLNQSEYDIDDFMKNYDLNKSNPDNIQNKRKISYDTVVFDTLIIEENSFNKIIIDTLVGMEFLENSKKVYPVPPKFEVHDYDIPSVYLKNRIKRTADNLDANSKNNKQ